MNNEQENAQRELFLRSRASAAARLAAIRNNSNANIQPTKQPVEQARSTLRNDIQRHTNTQSSNDASSNNASLSERVAELEVRVFQLWNLLTEKSLTTGNQKLNKVGRNFADRFNRR